MPSLLLLLLVLAEAAPARAWSRPLWYQVGLDLQPWGCQPSSLDGCGVSLGCPGHWLGLGANPVYSVTGVMITSAMVLVVGHRVLRWQGLLATQSEVTVLQMRARGSGPCKRRRPPASDQALLLTVLHMLDALLAQIQGHLQRLAAQRPQPIKGTATPSG